MRPRERGVTFNLATLFETAADAVGERTAMITDRGRFTYADLEERSNRLANHLTARGVGAGDHVGLMLLNGTEYVEGMLAAYEVRAVPINVNYRYVETELRYLFDDANLVGLVFHRQFADRVAAVTGDLPKLRTFLVVDDGASGDGPAGTEEYEAALAAASPARPPADGRSGDDIYIAYTGGTTGMPKGVMWRHEDIFFASMGGGDPYQSGNSSPRPRSCSAASRDGDRGPPHSPVHARRPRAGWCSSPSTAVAPSSSPPAGGSIPRPSGT